MRSLPTGWLAVIGLAAVIHGAPAAAQSAPRFELEVDMADEITMANRPAAVGTNVRTARTQRHVLKRGRIEEMVSPPIIAAMKACKSVKSDAQRLRVRVAESTMKDSIGDSLTPLKGIGLYLSLPETGVVDRGTWSVATFVALTIELRDDKGRVLASQEVAAFEREIAPEGMTAGDFVAQTSANLDVILDRLVRARVEKAMPAVLGGVCV